MYRNQLYFHTATVNHAKRKIFKKPILFTIAPKGKIFRNKANQEVKDLDTGKLQNVDERN